MIRDDLKIHKANQKIVNAIIKNCKNGEWKTRNLKPEDCKVGDVVLNFEKSILFMPKLTPENPELTG
jgi:hypothetical protein